MSDGGKGDNRRPEDTKAFEDGYSRIFGEKPIQRGKWVYDTNKRDFVPAEEYIREPVASYVMGDIQPYQSMATGEMIMGRRQHREHMKNHGLVEIGNETKYISQRKELSAPSGLREAIAREVYKRG